MTLKEKIKEDMKAAFKAGDQATRSALSMLLSVIQNRELEKRAKIMKAGTATEADVAAKSELTDEEVVDAVSSEVKKRRESIATYEQGGRPELAASERHEAEVLSRYLPEQLSEDDVKQLIAKAVQETGASAAGDMGKVMGKIAPAIKGRFDGARANALVKEALGA
ncbi:MAG TPA: GatB/YqeY domain-containing protein [Candidatus Paceibacterota bacterium]|nr:GatB/YqeY domain-containing protein [Candidatus Paceibacterota bacterium]